MEYGRCRDVIANLELLRSASFVGRLLAAGILWALSMVMLGLAAHLAWLLLSFGWGAA